MPPTDRYRFGDFVLCPSTRELRRGPERVALPAKSFDCIAYLLTRRERAVGRDELASAVWGRVDVGEAVLNQTVLHARRALGETARAQSAIRTVVGFGYHWVAPTEVVPASDASATLPAASKFRWRRTAALAAAGIVAVLGIRLLYVEQPAATIEALPRHALVVLPVDAAGTADDAWLRLGMMDLIASRLRDAGATVAPSDSVVTLARGFDMHDASDLDRLVHTLGARTLLRTRADRTDGGWHVALAAPGDPAL
ncbi:MAG TPA: winged helix-turn-helix domain-containing protein, partial [Rhodanobacteraceae bacterium]|nr:winged helix-turn-helix domain-containing protein [Rhodanobacteraceae bacterium]